MDGRIKDTIDASGSLKDALGISGSLRAGYWSQDKNLPRIRDIQLIRHGSR